MTRRRGRALPPAGVLAYHDVMCPICDRLIQRHVSQIVMRKGEWVHVGCVNGGDE